MLGVARSGPFLFSRHPTREPPTCKSGAGFVRARSDRSGPSPFQPPASERRPHASPVDRHPEPLDRPSSGPTRPRVLARAVPGNPLHPTGDNDVAPDGRLVGRTHPAYPPRRTDPHRGGVMTAPIYPVRLLSPTHRRIATVAMGSPASKQLQALGWTAYFGPATTYEQHKGGNHIAEACDPRNGFIVPGSDPELQATGEVGSRDMAHTTT